MVHCETCGGAGILPPLPLQSRAVSRTTAFDPIYKLVIFDCDGVLVDSEMLSARVLMGQLSEIGIDLSFAQFRSDFLGRSFASASAQLNARTGKVLPDDFAQQYFSK